MGKTTKAIVLALLLLVLAGGLIFLLVQVGMKTSGTDNSLAGSPPAEEHFKGGKDAKVTLVEYSDFQCPACGSYYPILKSLAEEFGDKIKFVYRYFPLSQIHQNAELSSWAAEAAGKQGKFWEMHNLLFENQRYWAERFDSTNTFLGYAKSLGLDPERFKTDLNSKETKSRVRADYESGLSSSVRGTPTFFLNGKQFQNPRSLDEFKAILEEAINANPS